MTEHRPTHHNAVRRLLEHCNASATPGRARPRTELTAIADGRCRVGVLDGRRRRRHRRHRSAETSQAAQARRRPSSDRALATLTKPWPPTRAQRVERVQLRGSDTRRRSDGALRAGSASTDSHAPRRPRAACSSERPRASDPCTCALRGASSSLRRGGFATKPRSAEKATSATTIHAGAAREKHRQLAIANDGRRETLDRLIDGASHMTTRAWPSQLTARKRTQRRSQGLRPLQDLSVDAKRTSTPRQQAAADRTVDRAGSASRRRQARPEAARRTLLNSVSFSPPRTSSVNSGSLTMLKSSS